MLEFVESLFLLLCQWVFSLIFNELLGILDKFVKIWYSVFRYFFDDFHFTKNGIQI